jgi:hypothetical protein
MLAGPAASIFPDKDTEVLMKTSLSSIYFLCGGRHRKTASLSGSIAVDKTCLDREITISPRQLIYESTADDVFWVLHSKLQGEKQLKCFL